MSQEAEKKGTTTTTPAKTQPSSSRGASGSNTKKSTATSKTSNPYISSFIRSVSQEAEKKETATTPAKTQPSPSQGPSRSNTKKPTATSKTSNPYISSFIRSVSQEAETTGGTAAAATKSGSKRQPSAGCPDNPLSQGGDGSAVKKPRVYAGTGSHATTTRTRGYRRALRQEPPKVEGVRRDMERMEISSTGNNPYVDKFVRGLSERRVPSRGCMLSSCPKLIAVPVVYMNPYVVEYHQKVTKGCRVCQPSRPNCYVAQLHRR